MLLTSALGLNIGLPEKFNLNKIEDYEFYMVLNVLKQKILYKGKLNILDTDYTHSMLSVFLNNKIKEPLKKTQIKTTNGFYLNSRGYVVDKGEYVKSLICVDKLPTVLLDLEPTNREQCWRAAMNSNCFVKQPDGTFVSFYSLYPRYELPPAYLSELQDIFVINNKSNFMQEISNVKEMV